MRLGKVNLPRLSKLAWVDFSVDGVELGIYSLKCLEKNWGYAVRTLSRAATGHLRQILVFNTGSDLPWLQAIERMPNARFAVPRHEGVRHTLYRLRLHNKINVNSA